MGNERFNQRSGCLGMRLVEGSCVFVLGSNPTALKSPPCTWETMNESVSEMYYVHAELEEGTVRSIYNAFPQSSRGTTRCHKFGVTNEVLGGGAVAKQHQFGFSFTVVAYEVARTVRYVFLGIDTEVA